jgi:hypothetical protein
MNYSNKKYNNYSNSNSNSNTNTNTNKHRVSWKDNDNYSDSIEENNDNTNINIKSVILDYLYNKIEVSDHKYNVIKNIGDIYELKNHKYYVSCNSCGINSFLIFMKKDNNYYSYLVDRRSISYNRNTLKKHTVRFTEIKMAVDLKLYEGTIIDGILIDNDNNKLLTKGETKNNKMKFLISDVFTFCGKSLLSMNYKKKMITINTILTEFLDKNKVNSNNIELFVSRPFELNQTSDLFAEYILPYSKIYNIKGLTFYPECSGSKIIYIFDKQDDKIKNELNNRKINIISSDKNINDNDDNLQLLETSDTKKIFKFELVNPECIDDIVLNLEMKKTDICDVYKLYGIFYNSKKYIKKCIGIAYIPTYELSLKCKLFFINHNSKIMNCKFNSYKGKWVPIDEANIQKIDIVNNEKRLKITEEEIIDKNIIGED